MNKFASSYLGAMGRKCADLHKEKKHRDYSVPIGLGLAGAGYGLRHLGNTMISPLDEAYMRQATGFVDEIEKAAPEARPDLYIRHMVPASRSKAWGFDVVDLSKVIRQNLHRVVGTDNAIKMIGNHPWDEHSGDHYRKFFQKGETSALRHEIPAGTGWGFPAKDGNPGHVGIVPDPKTDYTTQAQTEQAFDNVAARTAVERGIGGPEFSPAQELEIYSNLRKNIKNYDPRLHSTMLKLEGNLGQDLAQGASGYATMANAAIDVRDKLLIGGAAAGLTGLGLLGWYAWRKAHAKKNELEGKKAPAPVEFNLPVAGASIKLAILAHHVSSSLQH